MNFLVLSCVFLLFNTNEGRKISVNEDGDCSVDGIDDDIWNSQKIFNDHVKDSDIGKVIFNSTYKNILSVSCVTNPCYFDVTLDANVFLVTTNEKIVNIDKDTKNKTSYSYQDVKTTMDLTCSTGTRHFKFTVSINDTNNYPPEFSAPSYEFLLPMPLPRGIDLSQFGSVIAVRDSDFSKQSMTFSSDRAGIEFNSKYSEDQEFTYILEMKFSSITRLSKNETFSLTATDSTTPTRSGQTKIIFTIDEKNSEPYKPVFKKPSFLYKYLPDTTSVQPNEGETATLEEGRDDIECEIEGDLKACFEKPEVQGLEIEIKLKDALPDKYLTQTVAKVTLSCYVSSTSGSRSDADIIISIPEVQQTATFSHSTYNATYIIAGDEHEVKMEENITIQGDSIVVSIQIEDTYSSFFQIETIKGENNQWTLKIMKNLNSDLLKRSTLNMMISLLNDENRLLDKASIILILPNGKEEVGFTLPLFTGKYVYDKSGRGKLTIDSSISLNSPYVEVSNPSLEGDYSNSFAVRFKEPISFEITKIKDLPKEVLDKGVIPLTLHIDLKINEVSQSAETAFLLYLAASEDDDGDCNIEGISADQWQSQIIINDSINDLDVGKQIFSSPYENIEAVLDCVSGACYFDIKLDGKNIQIVSNSKLPNIDLDTKQKTSKPSQDVKTKINLQCTTGTKALTFTVQVVDTNNHEPSFSKSTYSYSMPMPMPPGVNLIQFGEKLAVNDLDFSNTDIKFTSDIDGLKFKTIYSENEEFPFILEMEFSSFKRLSKDLTFTLTATDVGSIPKNTTAKVSFYIDEKNSEPVFTKPSFMYQYDPDTGKISPREGEEISLEESRDDIVCEMTGALKSYFEKPTVNAKIINVHLKGKLPEQIVVEGVITATLSCYINGMNDATVDADVVISIPQDTKLTEAFSESTFSAKYKIEDEKHKIEMDGNIKIQVDISGVSIKVEEEYATFFEVKQYDDKDDEWVLSLKQNLDSTLLNKDSLSIVITLLNIQGQQLDKAAVLLLLPNGETGVSFRLPMFLGSYVFDESGEGSLNFQETIDLNSPYVEISHPSLQGEYSQYFSVDLEGQSTIKVSKSKNLPRDVLEKEVLPLTLGIDIMLGTISQSAKTALLINLSDGSKPSTEQPTTSNPNHDDDCDNSSTIWIIMVIVLLVILILYIGATLLYYFKKIRNGSSNLELPYEGPKVEPHFQKRTSHDKKLKDVTTRRPTGFIRFNADLDRDSVDSNDNQEELNNNTNANKFIPAIPSEKSEEDEKSVESGEERSGSNSVPMTLAEELKKKVQERESKMI